jgi:hypothetical protein
MLILQTTEIRILAFYGLVWGGGQEASYVHNYMQNYVGHVGVIGINNSAAVECFGLRPQEVI